LLNRPPNTDGVKFWQQQIDLCGFDQTGINAQRVRVAGAFFLPTEFQETGFWSAPFYRASFGRAPRFQQFMPDLVKLQNGGGGGQAGWRDVLENNQRAFAEAWTQRQDFKSVFDGKSNSEYVLTLLANAGLPPTNARI
jgi:hypothetical protein